jgi:hypothetical protein
VFQCLFDVQDFDSEAFVRQHLTPEHERIILDCIRTAIDEYRNKYAKLRYKHSSRTEASIINDLIIANIKEKYGNFPNTYYVSKNNLFVLGINNGAVIIRFKKMD